MRRLLGCGLFALLLCGSAYAAQEAWRIHWRCPVGASGCIAAWGEEGTTGSFPTKAACEDFIRLDGGSRRNGYPLNTWCEPGSGGSDRSRRDSYAPTNMPDALWQVCLIGGAAGASWASFMKENAEGRKPYLELAVNWCGWGLGIATLASAKHMPALGFGVSAGLATAAAWGGFQGYKNFSGRADFSIKSKKDIAIESAIFGAAVGAGAYGLKKLASRPVIGPVVRTLDRIHLLPLGRRFVASIVW